MIRGLCLLLCLLAAPAFAQDKPAKQPLEITADQSLEWHRDAQLYIARQNAVAKQGLSELHGDVLTAAYKDGEGNKGTVITRIDAVGNVVVVSDGSRATGDRGYYDVAQGYSELTGHNLMLKTKTDTVTARDKMTYHASKREMRAYGNAKAVRGDDVIVADQLVGRFIDDGAGGTKMDELEGIGNVVITTPTDVLHGDRGVYRAGPNTATITGNVRIDRGPNIITGARGEVDLNTNVSRIFGSAVPGETGADGRVRGVFYPE